jgi:putative flippase GtrA
MTYTYVTHTIFTFHTSKWTSDRREEVFEFITEHLLRQTEKPIKCAVFVSPKLANEIKLNNLAEFESLILNVPVEFDIDWSMTDSKLRLTIS